MRREITVHHPVVRLGRDQRRSRRWYCRAGWRWWPNRSTCPDAVVGALGDRVLVMTTRPGRIKQTLHVDFGRPRNYKIRSSRQYLTLKSQIFEAVREEAVPAERGVLLGAAAVERVRDASAAAGDAVDVVLAQRTRVSPRAEAVAIAQDRRREEAFVRSCGIDTAPYIDVEKAEDLAHASRSLLGFGSADGAADKDVVDGRVHPGAPTGRQSHFPSVGDARGQSRRRLPPWFPPWHRCVPSR